MNEGLLWKSNVTEWDRVSLESYRFVIEQAKERLNEVIEESHTITKRGMAILLSYLTVLSSLLGYIFSDKFKIHNTIFTISIVLILALSSLYVFTLLFAFNNTQKAVCKRQPTKGNFL